MTCTYCREAIKDGATVCPSCGAYAVDKRGQLVWYRKGDSPARAAWVRWRWLLVVAVICIGLALSALQSMQESDRKARETVCEVVGGPDC